MSIKFKSSIESEGKIIQSKHRSIKHTDTVQTLEVKVVTKTAAHPYHGSDSNFGYTIDGVEGAYLELTPGITYRFDQSDASNGGTGNNNQSHPLRFATAKDAAGSTEYTGSEVTTNGTPGSSGAYTQIAPTTSTPTILHYYCSAHNGMGSYAKFGTQSATDLTGFDTDDLAESSTNKYLTQANLGQRSIGDLLDVNTTGVANNKILKYDSSTSKFIIADDGGSSSSAITIQEEGNPLSTAATTLNFVGSSVTATGSGATKTITISGGGGGSSSGQVTVQKNVSGTSPTEATDGSRTDFTITSTPASKNNLQIYIDGVYQAKTAFEVSGTTVALDAAPASGAVVEIIHFTVIDANIFLQSHTTTSGQTSFNAGGVIANINDTQVYIDGVYQNKGNYTISGSNVVLNPAPATGAVVEIVNIKASAASSGSVTWETGIKAANFNAVAGKGYFVNTTSNTVTVTLPSGSAGDEIHFTDYASTFDTNKISFTQASGQKIQGRTTPAKCILENSTVRLIYQDDTKGWTADNIANDPPAANVYYLVIAGGGGGGNGASGGGGGGGAGGYRTNFGGTALPLNPLTNINVTVGTGGAGAPGGSGGALVGADGVASSYGSISAAGGGGGGYGVSNHPEGNDGGSGGGGGGNAGASTGAGGSGNTPQTTPSQGNDGGSSSPNNSLYWGGGGGGGIGSAGANGAYNSPGNGGTGTTNGITGTDVTYAAGGGGGSWRSDSSNGTGGSGIGGNGGKGNQDGTNGSAYTGSGGGGGGKDWDGGNGADGVVILRYQGTLTPQSGHTLVTSHINQAISGTGEVYTRFTGGSGNIQIN